MYTRYRQYSGFFEPEYELPFTYTHERVAHEQQERERLEREQQESEQAEREKQELERLEKERHETVASGRDAAPRPDRTSRRKEKREQESRQRELRNEEYNRLRAERGRQAAERAEKLANERSAERERRSKGRGRREESPRRSSPGLDLGRLRSSISGFKPTGILEGLGLDSGDVLLIVLLLYLYEESQDPEMLILLGLLFLI